MATLDQVLAEIKADVIQAIAGQVTPLSESQLQAIRAGMYVARYPSDPPVRHDRC